nr:unnamed protein product [Callosobruchus chinensis]
MTRQDPIEETKQRDPYHLKNYSNHPLTSFVTAAMVKTNVTAKQVKYEQQMRRLLRQPLVKHNLVLSAVKKRPSTIIFEDT